MFYVVRERVSRSAQNTVALGLAVGGSPAILACVPLDKEKLRAASMSRCRCSSVFVRLQFARGRLGC